MAVLRHIQQSTAISSFPQTVRPGASIFDVLSEGMAGFADHFDVRAREVAERQGAEMGAGAAGSYMPNQPGSAPGTPYPGSYQPAPAAREGLPQTAGSMDAAWGTAQGGAGEGVGSVDAAQASGYPEGIAAAMNRLPIGGDMSSMPQLYELASQAWGYVMPPGSRIEVSSAFRSHEEANHNGRAIDFAVYRPDGSLVAWNDPEAVRAAQFGRALGIGGIGAGPTYMGGSSFHWDINSPRVWSDDDGGASDSGPGAAQWGAALQEAEQLGVEGLLQQAGVTMSSRSPVGPAVDATPPGSFPEAPPARQGETGTPVTQIRNAAGELEVRPIDAFTSRYEMIRQNAALGTYSAAVLNNARLAMSDLSRRYDLDPDGFSQAAQGYIQQSIANAPAQIREQLSHSLQAEAGRTMNGILDARYRNTIQLAQNETAALATMYSNEYATLYAQGDMEGAAAAMANFRSALNYRTQLPGSTFGPEQVELAVLGAQQDAVDMAESRRQSRNTEAGDRLTEIRQIATRGGRSEDEGFLYTEDAQAHPSFNQTMAAVNLRDMRPDFFRMTPEAQASLIEQERSRPVGEDWEIDFLDAMESIHTETVTGLRDDPIAYAQERLSGVPGLGSPPDIPDFDGTNAAEVQRALTARVAYGQRLSEAGYTDAPVYLSAAERERLAPLLAPETDPSIRAGMVNALIAGAGPNAMAIASEMNASRTTLHVIGLASQGVQGTVIVEAFAGEAMLREGQAREPSAENRIIANFAPDLAPGVPASAALQGVAVEVAMNIAAARGGGQPPDANDMEEALQIALGYQDNGERPATGGVQSVFGSPTLLPPGVSARDVEGLFPAGTGTRYEWNNPGDMMPVNLHGGFYNVPFEAPGNPGITIEEWNSRELLEQGGYQRFETRAEANAALANPPESMWGEQGAPYYADEPITRSVMSSMTLEPYVRNGRVAVGRYLIRGRDGYATTEDGRPFLLNTRELMDVR